jgi:15-cis-phytoene synthase
MADATVRAGAQAIARGSRSFAAAALLFDRPTRESVAMLYAWCRHCDDVIDGQELGHPTDSEEPTTAVSRIDGLGRKTRAVLAGERVAEPAFDGLGRVVHAHAIPACYPLAHLDGFRMDVEGRRYASLADTLDYCYHVAGVVGLMMAHVMGVRDPAVLDRACDLGIAFQLTNIARDIVPDAGAGRIYVPAAWLDAEGLPASEIADPSRRDALARIAARLVAEAEPYYASALVGIAALPPRSAWAIATAHGVYGRSASP